MFGPCVQLRNFCRAGQPFACAQGFCDNTRKVTRCDILRCRQIGIIDFSALELTYGIGMVSTVFATLNLSTAIEGQLRSVPSTDVGDTDSIACGHFFHTMLDIALTPECHLLRFTGPFLRLDASKVLEDDHLCVLRDRISNDPSGRIFCNGSVVVIGIGPKAVHMPASLALTLTDLAQ